MTKVKKADYQVIPYQVDEARFNEFFLPRLWLGSRGPKPKIPLFKIFNYILWVLYTGCQWKALMQVIDRGPDGKPEIHYTTVYRWYAKWCEKGCWEKVHTEVLRALNQQGKLDLSVLHGDGSNVVAKKGGSV